VRVAALLLIAAVSAWAEGFWVADYAEAVRLAKKEHKLIMVEAMRPGCYYCQVMEEEVFDDPEAQEAIRMHVIPLKIDLDRDKMPMGIKARVTPSFYFLTAEGEEVKRLMGGWYKEDFISILETLGGQL